MGYFFPKPARKFFFAPSCPRTFPHCRPLQPPFPRGNVENSVETVKNPCPHAGFTFPRFHNGFRLCKRTCLFFLFRTKIAFFRPAEHPQDTGGIWPLPALSCVKWERANFFPTVCPQGFNIHFISCPGASRPGWKTVQTQRNPYAIPRFCGILAAKPRVFRRVFTKAPQRAACFPRKTQNVYLCTKFVEHRIGRFFP